MLENYEVILEKWIQDPVFGKIIFIIIAIIFLLTLKRYILKNAITKIGDKKARYQTRKIINFFLFLIIVFIISIAFNEKMEALTVTFGVIGAGVAFALQEVITSVAGWINITLNKVFNIGDRVQLGGIKGDVIDISVLTTTIMEIGAWVDGDLYNGRVVKVSNSCVFKDAVFNYSGEFPFLWDEVIISVTHDSDIKEAMLISEEIASQIQGDYEQGAEKKWNELLKKYVLEDAKVGNFSSITFDMNAVHIKLRYVTNFKERRKTKSVLSETILQRFQAAENIHFAGATLEITNLKDIK